MNVLILGGQSARHEAWVRQVQAALQPHFERAVILDYRHWREGGDMDIAYEMAQAAQLAADLDEYVVVAKSIGTVVATLDIATGQLHPARCVFLGFPLRSVVQSMPAMQPAFASLPPVVFVQNEHDPLGDAAAVQPFVAASNAPAASFVTIPGSTHDYLDFALITRLATAGVAA